MMDRQIDNPITSPLGFVVKNALKICSKSSGLIPELPAPVIG